MPKARPIDSANMGECKIGDRDAAIWSEVKARLNGRAEEFVVWLFPSARKTAPHEVSVGSLAGEPGESLSVCMSGDKVGVWSDFATGDKGGNLLELLIKARGIEPGEALRLAADWLGMALPVRAVAAAKQERKQRFVCAYDYRYRDGRLAHQTLRYHYIDVQGREIIDPKTGSPEKTFRQRRPAERGMRQGNYDAKKDGDGNWWLWTLKGIQPVLYRLPQIHARAEDAVWIVEGEKDADALSAAGVLATTSAMGAGKWHASYTAELRGRRVVLCGDHDVAGRRGILRIGEALEPVCESVEVVRWPAALEVLGLADRAGEKWDVARLLAEEVR